MKLIKILEIKLKGHTQITFFVLINDLATHFNEIKTIKTKFLTFLWNLDDGNIWILHQKSSSISKVFKS